MAEQKEHHLTRAKRLREEALAGSVASIPDAPEVVESFRILSKRGDVVAYASSRSEAQNLVKDYDGGYIVKV